MKEIKLLDELALSYDRLYVFPANGQYVAFYGDTEYIFNDDEIQQLCDKFNSIGCTSFQLTKEDLLEILEKINKENNND